MDTNEEAIKREENKIEEQASPANLSGNDLIIKQLMEQNKQLMKMFEELKTQKQEDAIKTINPNIVNEVKQEESQGITVEELLASAEYKRNNFVNPDQSMAEVAADALRILGVPNKGIKEFFENYNKSRKPDIII